MDSFLHSFLFSGVLLAGIDRLVLHLVNLQPPRTDEAGYAFGLFVLAVLTTLSEIAALGLGIAGALQRHRKRLSRFSAWRAASSFWQ